MKVIAIVLGILSAAAVVVTVAINVYTPSPDNSKAMEMQRKDIENMRRSVEEMQKKHPNPFKTDQ